LSNSSTYFPGIYNSNLNEMSPFNKTTMSYCTMARKTQGLGLRLGLSFCFLYNCDTNWKRTLPGNDSTSTGLDRCYAGQLMDGVWISFPRELGTISIVRCESAERTSLYAPY
jgi:hypothetical protein